MATPDGGTDQEKFEKLLAEMDWLEEPQENMYTSRFELLKLKFMQNPAVPIGCIVTATVLGLGISNFAKGGPAKRSQSLMRWRVGLQSATIGATAIGLYYEQYSRSKKK